ncbi:MAG: MFS transporter [Anaerolineae bacterium]
MDRWKRTFVSSFIAQVLSVIGFSFVLPFLPFFIRELGVADEAQQAWWSGIVLAASGVTFFLCGPLWGALADRWGRKPMVVRAMFAGTVVLYLMSCVQTVGQLLLCRLAQGATTGTIAASVALVASVTPQRRSGFALGMMQAAVFLGVAVGPLIGGILADLFGYRVTFRIGAGIVFIGGLLNWLGAHEDFSPPARDGTGLSVRGLFAQRPFLVGVGVLLLVRFSNTMTNPSFPLIVRDILPSDDRLNSVTGMVIASAALTGAVAAAWLGHVGDRLGFRRVLVTCAVGAAVMSALHAPARSIPMLTVVHLLFGLAIAGILPAANAIIQSAIDRRHIGKAYGWATSISMSGIALGPLIGGYVGRDFGLRAPFLLAALFQLLLAVAALFALRPAGANGLDTAGP